MRTWGQKEDDDNNYVSSMCMEKKACEDLEKKCEDKELKRWKWQTVEVCRRLL